MNKRIIERIYTSLAATLVLAAMAAPSPEGYKKAPEPGVQPVAAYAPDHFRRPAPEIEPNGWRVAPEVEPNVYRRP